jgi:hypothetical protein
MTKPLTFLGRPVPPAFERREIPLAAGTARAYVEGEWRGALVVVERGEIELEWLGGGRWRVTRGDVLWLVGLRLRALHNPGAEPALLVAISRRRPEWRGRPMSFVQDGRLSGESPKSPTMETDKRDC